MLQLRGLDLQRLDGLGPLRYLASLHGSSLPVFLPHVELGLPERPIGARSGLVLLRTSDQTSEDKADCALAVDSISRMEELPASRCRLPRQVRLGEKWRDVLDVDVLCRPLAGLDLQRRIA
jgi:hypothetical protein